MGKERQLGFEALCASYVGKGEFILVSGCNNACFLYTKDGVKVAPVGDPQKSWVWSCAHHPTANYVVSFLYSLFRFIGMKTIFEYLPDFGVCGGWSGGKRPRSSPGSLEGDSKISCRRNYSEGSWQVAWFPMSLCVYTRTKIFILYIT